ncbi:hypothetical protein BV394_02660 [Brevirhabdus pacifica]|uniref:Uncharacterized protein n=1 Tax=Brevirhabdus pacifica TaxID=1267768 RepID=A0A1U7DFJ6_9RHOB|nr:DUF2182 domain-containing protein [Brevirhabdus pacifica]APX88767.1 hypothetical protein BV394_02660 [Brevirhabdus pacifica]OWU80021.1 membrane protein [Loktanella sp. 22II-4b]PJJ86707.1 putative metal-binding integral membrane protein DUF2182 [Brevirhabdus pacifica]
MVQVTRSLLWLAFFAAILAAWFALYRMTGMAGVDLVGRPSGMNMMGGADFATLFWMWTLMMAAMMLPTLVPALQVYEDLMRSAGGTRGGWLGLMAGYFMVWLVFAAGIAAAQLWLREAGVLDGRGMAVSGWVAAALLLVTGAYQFTAIKRGCHARCHSPLGLLLTDWDPSTMGGLRHGIRLGAFCCGCCWGFMALGFVGGTMSLLWMGLATVFMVLEKLPELGHRLMRPGGAVLIAAGLLVAAGQLGIGPFA